MLARTNAQLAAFEAALDRARIPYRSGGGQAFLQRQAVRGALGALRRDGGPSGLAAWHADLLESVRDGEPPDGDGSTPGPGGSGGPRAAGGEAGPGDPDLAVLARMTADYLDGDPAPSAEGFLGWLETSLHADPPRQAGDAVDLCSFHRAKGLEWPVVFVTGLEAGLVPIAHARRPDELAEERRLLYVACTRAEEELHCSWAETRSFGGRASRREPSPYLDAIDGARRELERVAGLAPDHAVTGRRAVRALLDARAAEAGSA